MAAFSGVPGMHVQPITWLCGCESTIRINGTADEGRIVAAYYAQYACHGHDPTRRPVSWLGREGVAFVVEEVRREERTDSESGLRLAE